MGNNPINFIDPDGGWCFNAQGEIIPCPDGYNQYDGPSNEHYKFGGSIMASTDGVPVINELPEITITHSQSNSSFLLSFIEGAMVFSDGFVNAWGTNQILGYGRAGSFQARIKWGEDSLTTYYFGQLTGDLTSLVTGAIEVKAGGLSAGAGVIGTPVSGGASLGVSVAGLAVAAHGASVQTVGAINTARSISNLLDQFGKKNHGSGTGGGSFKKLSSNKDANKYAKSKGYRDAHDLKESHVGKGNESKFDIEINSATREGRLISKDGKIIIPIY